MNSPANNSCDLAALISQLWRQGQRSAGHQSALGTVNAGLSDTPHPLAAELQQFWEEQIFRKDRRSTGSSSAERESDNG